jgi:hypothetical protein
MGLDGRFRLRHNRKVDLENPLQDRFTSNESTLCNATPSARPRDQSVKLSLYTPRPDGVARNSENGPNYSDLDLRWGYDFKLEPREADKSPTLGLSASALNVLNEGNGSYIDTVQGSQAFNQVIAAYPARRIQLAMRFTF